KGYPEGHSHLIRHMSVPIMDRHDIVAVAGVGNKDAPYDETDLRQLMLYVGRMWDFVKRKRIEDELQSANEKLRRLSELKSQFVAHVSHESKSPIAVIQGALGMVLEGTMGEVTAEQRDILTMGHRAAERLGRLVSDLLDLAKIEAGKIDMRLEDIELIPLIDEIAASFHQRLVLKRQTFKKDMPGGIGKIRADRDKLSEILANLMTNASKYTPEEGSIGVKLTGDGEKVRVEVWDSGPGIPEDYREKVFDKYCRITAEKEEGTGLGLAIAKELVELHRGKIWVESEMGKGSTFIFTIPRDPEA
ncbi:MAG: GAF domain-containing sensor histidine kinase, partial [Elusimicrobiota bacterium]